MARVVVHHLPVFVLRYLVHSEIKGPGDRHFVLRLLVLIGVGVVGSGPHQKRAGREQLQLRADGVGDQFLLGGGAGRLQLFLNPLPGGVVTAEVEADDFVQPSRDRPALPRGARKRGDVAGPVLGNLRQKRVVGQTRAT